jgi:hypothetical protein
LGEVMSFFSALAFKNVTVPGIVQSIFRSLNTIIKKNVLHLQACDLDHFLNCVLLALQAQTPKDVKQDKEKVSTSTIIVNEAFDMIKNSINIMDDE